MQEPMVQNSANKVRQHVNVQQPSIKHCSSSASKLLMVQNSGQKVRQHVNVQQPSIKHGSSRASQLPMVQNSGQKVRQGEADISRLHAGLVLRYGGGRCSI